ncbi:MAG: hypothetical protein QW273_02995 [Candidatus Pacearchaeota archaeon]
MGIFSQKKEDLPPFLPPIDTQKNKTENVSTQGINFNSPQQERQASQPQKMFFQPQPQISARPIENVSVIRQTREEPFFVRIDKFNEAKRNLNEIEKRLREMEAIIEKISEMNKKEENEVEEWKSNLAEIRRNLQEINSSVFDRI